MHIGRPVVIHPNYDEDILDVSVDSSQLVQHNIADSRQPILFDLRNKKKICLKLLNRTLHNLLYTMY